MIMIIVIIVMMIMIIMIFIVDDNDNVDIWYDYRYFKAWIRSGPSGKTTIRYSAFFV
jgi:hypothetical protein